MKPKYVIIGAGGHAKSVADVILSTGSTVSFFEDSKKAGQSIFGNPIISSLAEISTLNCHFLAVGIGDKYVRKKLRKNIPRNILI